MNFIKVVNFAKTLYTPKTFPIAQKARFSVFNQIPKEKTFAITPKPSRIYFPKFSSKKKLYFYYSFILGKAVTPSNEDLFSLKGGPLIPTEGRRGLWWKILLFAAVADVSKQISTTAKTILSLISSCFLKFFIQFTKKHSKL